MGIDTADDVEEIINKVGVYLRRHRNALLDRRDFLRRVRPPAAEVDLPSATTRGTRWKLGQRVEMSAGGRVQSAYKQQQKVKRVPDRTESAARKAGEEDEEEVAPTDRGPRRTGKASGGKSGDKPRRMLCYNCDESGHRWQNCPQPLRASLKKQVNCIALNGVTVGAVARKGPQVQLKTTVQGRKQRKWKWSVDSGAECCVMSYRAFRTLCGKKFLRRDKTVFVMADGTHASSQGAFHVTLQRGSKRYQTTVHVLKNAFASVLSLEGCLALGILPESWPYPAGVAMPDSVEVDLAEEMESEEEVALSLNEVRADEDSSSSLYDKEESSSSCYEEEELATDVMATDLEETKGGSQGTDEMEPQDCAGVSGNMKEVLVLVLVLAVVVLAEVLV